MFTEVKVNQYTSRAQICIYLPLATVLKL